MKKIAFQRRLAAALLIMSLPACTSSSLAPAPRTPGNSLYVIKATGGRIYFVDPSRIMMRGSGVYITDGGRGAYQIAGVASIDEITVGVMIGPPVVPHPGIHAMCGGCEPVEIDGGNGGQCAWGTGNASSFSFDGNQTTTYTWTAGYSGSYTVTLSGSNGTIASGSLDLAAGQTGRAQYTGPLQVTNASDSGPNNDNGTAYYGSC